MTVAIDLSRAQAGTRFEARDGEVWTYIGPSFRHDVYEYSLQGSDLVKCIFTRDGHYWVVGESPHDLVRTIHREEAAPGGNEPASWHCIDLPFGDAADLRMTRRR
ncbi:hypothetical protein [Labrys monachus]|uniref:Uncharacterized protein n=1 Tax=Labrys monachus TaxID=217067 RepID=A0ABU0FN18_9HYPH|nr:hypothetical protein [Labrys monachus]MDQ0395504.1 hypothetical protein [Labrys monachus]